MDYKKAEALTAVLLPVLVENAPFCELAKTASKYQAALVASAAAAQQMVHSLCKIRALCGGEYSSMIKELADLINMHAEQFNRTADVLESSSKAVAALADTTKASATAMDRAGKRDRERHDAVVAAATKAFNKAKSPDAMDHAKRELEEATRVGEIASATRLRESLEIYQKQFRGVVSRVADVASVYGDWATKIAEGRDTSTAVLTHMVSMPTAAPADDKIIAHTESVQPGAPSKIIPKLEKKRAASKPVSKNSEGHSAGTPPASYSPKVTPTSSQALQVPMTQYQQHQAGTSPDVLYMQQQQQQQQQQQMALYQQLLYQQQMTMLQQQQQTSPQGSTSTMPYTSSPMASLATSGGGLRSLTSGASMDMASPGLGMSGGKPVDPSLAPISLGVK